MNLVAIAWTIIFGAILWLFVLWWWMKRNPKYSKQIRDKEAPYAWFFYVWGFLVIAAGISMAGLAFHYIYKAVMLFM